MSTKPKSLFLLLNLVFWLGAPGWALSEAEIDEVLTAAEDKLSSTWARLQYPQSLSVSVQFMLLPDGGYSGAAVVGSCGNKSIDQQAINAVDSAVPFRRFSDSPFLVIATFDTKRDRVTCGMPGKGRGSSKADKKIAIQKKYHQNAISIVLDRISKAEKVMGKDDIRLFESFYFLGGEYKKLKDYSKSEEAYNRALNILSKAKTATEAQKAKVLVALGEMYLDKGDTQNRENREKAEALFKEVTEMKEPGKEALASALENQAKLLYKDGKAKDAEPLYARIKELRAKTSP